MTNKQISGTLFLNFCHTLNIYTDFLFRALWLFYDWENGQFCPQESEHTQGSGRNKSGAALQGQANQEPRVTPQHWPGQDTQAQSHCPSAMDGVYHSPSKAR